MGGIKERPILFSGEMVRAILAGNKTQTRRVMKPQLPNEYRPVTISTVSPHWGFSRDGMSSRRIRCPYGKIGDRLWVREAWRSLSLAEMDEHPRPYTQYRATEPDSDLLKWKPSIHMPRWKSRILLEVTVVRVERVQDISDKDCRAEGVAWDCVYGVRCNSGRCPTHKRDPYHLGTRDDFRRLWDFINAKRGYSWQSNPFVWVVEFKRVDP